MSAPRGRQPLSAGEVRAQHPPLGVVPERGRTFEFACCQHCDPRCDDWHRQPCTVDSCVEGAQRIEADAPNAYAARYKANREPATRLIEARLLGRIVVRPNVALDALSDYARRHLDASADEVHAALARLLELGEIVETVEGALRAVPIAHVEIALTRRGSA